jgi:hypothetical protein
MDDKLISKPGVRLCSNLAYIGGPPGTAWTSGTTSKQRAVQIAANTVHGDLLEALNLRFPTEVLGGTATPARAPGTTKAGGPYTIPAVLLNGTKFIGETVPVVNPGDPEDAHSPYFWLSPIIAQRIPATFLMIMEGMLTATGIKPYLEVKPAPLPSGGQLLYIPGRNGRPNGAPLNVFSGNGGRAPDGAAASQNPTGRANLVSRRGLVDNGEYYVKVSKDSIPVINYGEVDTTENGNFGLHVLLRCSDEGPLGQPWVYSMLDMDQFIAATGQRGFFGVAPLSGLQEGRQIMLYVAFTDSATLWERAFTPLFPIGAGGLSNEELEEEDEFSATIRATAASASPLTALD